MGEQPTWKLTLERTPYPKSNTIPNGKRSVQAHGVMIYVPLVAPMHTSLHYLHMYNKLYSIMGKLKVCLGRLVGAYSSPYIHHVRQGGRGQAHKARG